MPLSILLIATLLSFNGVNCRSIKPPVATDDDSIESVQLWQFIRTSFYEYLTDTEDEEAIEIEPETGGWLVRTFQKSLGMREDEPEKIPRRDMLKFMSSSFFKFITGSESDNDNDGSDKPDAIVGFAKRVLLEKPKPEDEKDDVLKFVLKSFFKYITDTEDSEEEQKNSDILTSFFSALF